MGQENIGKEVMVTIPLAFIIQWNNKQVAPLQRFQHFLTIGLVGNGIA